MISDRTEEAWVSGFLLGFTALVIALHLVGFWPKTYLKGILTGVFLAAVIGYNFILLVDHSEDELAPEVIE